MKKIYTLERTDTLDFSVFAISSHVRGFKLCWNINKELMMDFEMLDDHVIDNNLYFSRYSYVCEEGKQYNILKNQSNKGYLIPEYKSINFFLLIDKEEIKKELILKLKKVKDILLIFEIKKEQIKNIERLII